MKEVYVTLNHFREECNYDGDNDTLQKFYEGERLNNFCEINWNDIIGGLIHTRNCDDVRKEDDKQEADGCHFIHTEKLFKYVCSLDKQKEDNKKRKIEEIKAEAERRDNEEKINQENNTNIKEV